MSFDFKKSIPWLDGKNVRPFILSRDENIPKNPGSIWKNFDWFNDHEVIIKNPLHIKELEFSDIIMDIEGRAFQGANMAMPRWVFFDCAVMPGFVSGFAHRTSTLPGKIKEAIGKDIEGEWVPLSLFISIPTANKEEWVAHNLTSINSLLHKEDRFYGMGFLTKAFGLWFGNIPMLYGMTQWESPALKLHCNYGDLEIKTAFTPVHSHPRTITYKCEIRPELWKRFFTKTFDSTFRNEYVSSGFEINPKDRNSMLELQEKLEQGQQKYYLDPEHLRNEALGDPIPIYIKK